MAVSLVVLPEQPQRRIRLEVTTTGEVVDREIRITRLRPGENASTTRLVRAVDANAAGDPVVYAPPDTTQVTWDYEAPLGGVTVVYRAEYRTQGSAGAWTAIADVPTVLPATADRGWVIHPPRRPLDLIHVHQAARSRRSTAPIDSGVFAPLGSQFELTIRGTRRKLREECVFRSTTETEAATLIRLLEDEPLLVIRRAPDRLWVSDDYGTGVRTMTCPGEVAVTETIYINGIKIEAAAQMIEVAVDTTDVTVDGFGVTYAQLRDSGLTYVQLLARFPTYADLTAATLGDLL